MNRLKNLNIIIIDIDENKINDAMEIFDGIDNIKCVNDDIRDYYSSHSDEIDTLVSPANSYGRMDGGYDAALSNILGWKFQYRVQDYIKEYFYGEQIVGTSFLIETDIDGLSLIHTPTMIRPSLIKDPNVIYSCMRSTLMCALEYECNTIVIPIFGSATGGISAYTACKKMREAYEQINRNI